MKQFRSLIVLAALAMIAGSCSQQGPQAFVDAPGIDTEIRTTAEFPDDGLTRLVITPITGAAPMIEPASAGPIEADTGATTDDTVGEVDPMRHLTPEMVAAVPAGTPLEVRDGQVGYVDDSGEFVALQPVVAPPTTAPAAPDPADSGSSDASSEPEPAMRYGNPHIDRLAADPAVESVIVIGDGTFGVTVSDPSVIDPRIFAVVEDVPFGLAVDQYEPYQWANENNGSNLQGVTAVSQVEDADLDVSATLDRADGSGVVVAVIDSGVDFSHSDLDNSWWTNLGETCGNGIDDDGNGYVDDCRGWDFGNNDAAPYDVGADSHGTHVSGIITANRNGSGIAGIAPDARIMDLNVAQRSSYGDSISGAAVTAAIRYAVDNGADIINMSLGSEPGTSAASVAPMGAAIDYAASKGVIVVVAAGNNGVDLASLPVYPASFDRPNMIVVGASTPADTRASFSNYGSGIVDVYAPGDVILSTVPGDDFRFMSGTSQASPAVAATAALVKQLNPDVAAADVIDAVVSSVDLAEALSTSSASGRINAATATGGNGDDAPIPTELAVRVWGVSDPGNEVSATVEIATPPDHFDEDHRWELTLVHTDANGAYAIVDHPFSIGGVVASTGADGALDLAGPDVARVDVGVTLPAGRYSFVIEAVPTADRSFRLGDAFVTTFEIPGDPEAPVDTTPPTTTPPTTTPTSTVPADPASGDEAAGSSTTAPSSNGGASGEGTSAGSSGSDDSGTNGTGGTGSGSTGSGSNGDSPTTTVPSSPSTSSAGSPTTTEATNSAVPTTAVPTTAAPTTSGPTSGGGDQDPGPGTDPGFTVPDTPAPVPSDIGDGTAKKGEWEATSVSPQAGYVNAANTVVIRGVFPSDTYVWFGDQPGQVVHQNRSQITVRTPLRAEPGVVDITLQKSPTGVVLRIPDAYAFASIDAGQTPIPGGGDSGGGDSGDAPTTDPGDSGSGGSDGSAPGEPSDGGVPTDGTPGDGTADETPSSNRRSRMIVGSAVELENGLRGGSVSPNLAAGVPVCSTEPCPIVPR